MRTIVLTLIAIFTSHCKTSTGGAHVKRIENSDARSHCNPLVELDWIKTFRQSLSGGNLQIRVGIAEPVQNSIGDILFLPGFADRLDNHRPLFSQWTDAGFRVISFDYPSHGETCGLGNDLNKYSFTELADLASYVVGIASIQPNSPLIIAGWSTGGLLATRIVQGASSKPWPRKIDGLLLLAPGLYVRPLVGEHGTVTEASLTNNSNPPHLGPIKPSSPMSVPLFAANLLLNSTKAQSAGLPMDLPSLIMVGGEQEDRYIKTESLVDWIKSQRQTGRNHLAAVQCLGAKHELDNEPDPVGKSIRRASVLFAKQVAKAKVTPGENSALAVIGGGCAIF